MFLSQGKQRMLGKNLNFCEAEHHTNPSPAHHKHPKAKPALSPKPRNTGVGAMGRQGTGAGSTMNPGGFSPPKLLLSRRTWTQPGNVCKFGAAKGLTPSRTFTNTTSSSKLQRWAPHPAPRSCFNSQTQQEERMKEIKSFGVFVGSFFCQVSELNQGLTSAESSTR